MRSTPVRECDGGVTTPRGFRAGGLYCGIRKAKKDIAIIVSRAPATVAAVFTINNTQAAPLIVDKMQLQRSPLCSALVVNSGNANACTGERGLNDAWEMVRTASEAIGVPEEQVLVSSTGVIGQYLPMDKVVSGIRQLAPVLTETGSRDAAEAIMTTDTYPKETAVQFSLGKSLVTIGGMAKGSGMIAPNMATMLAFITTDVEVPQPLLDRALRAAVDDTFNAITVDGECSTNDCVMIAANGASGAVVSEASFERFSRALASVCLRLAIGIVRGGEGATKLITVNVTGAASPQDARRAAKAIANSLLVKTAVHGGDPNWGRLVAVAGRAGVAFDLNRAAVTIGSTVLFREGCPHDEAAPEAAAHLQNDEVVMTVDLGSGDASSTVWTCDLSAEYVRINADYRT